MKRFLGGRLVRKLVPFFVAVVGFQGVSFATPAIADCLSMDAMELLGSGNGTYEACGGDDLSYKIPLGGTVIFGGNSYSTIYATTNSIITFGQPDYTYWDFPSTPSISLDSSDWVQRGFYSTNGIYSSVNSSTPRSDEYFTITVSGNTFRVDIAARPFSTYYSSLLTATPDGSPRLMSLYFVRNPDGTLRIRSFSSNSTDTGLRNGCVLTNGAAPISLEECGILEVASLSVLESSETVDYLVALTAPKISRLDNQVICSSGDLKYMIQGIQAQEAKLDSQVFSLVLDNQVIAQASTLENQAKFDASKLVGTGTLACVQSAQQGSATVMVRSDSAESETTSQAQLDKAIAAAKKNYYAAIQKSGVVKMDALRKHSSGDKSTSYQVAIDEWKLAIESAKATRDEAIAQAYENQVSSYEKDGVKLVLSN